MKDDIIPISIMVICLIYLIIHLPLFYDSLKNFNTNTSSIKILHMLGYIIFVIILSLAIRYYQKIKPGIRHPSSSINTWIIVFSVLNLIITLYLHQFYTPDKKGKKGEKTQKIYYFATIIVFFVSIVVLSSVEAYLNQRRPTSSSPVQSVLPPPNPSPNRVRSMDSMDSMDMQRTGLPM